MRPYGVAPGNGGLICRRVMSRVTLRERRATLKGVLITSFQAALLMGKYYDHGDKYSHDCGPANPSSALFTSNGLARLSDVGTLQKR